MAKQKGLKAYEDRYQAVFAAGALHWNDPRPNPHLSRLLNQLREHSDCIEFGCGEGYQARLIASQGHTVTGIDLSPTAIAKAIRETPPELQIRFLVGDVTDVSSLHLTGRNYDLVVDIGCLHMMAENDDRANYLNLVCNLLRRGGKFFLQNGLDLDDVYPQSEDEAKELAELRALQAEPAGHPAPRKIVTASGLREISIPLCPPCRMLSLNEYSRELATHGFRVLTAERTAGVNCRFEMFIVAERS